MAKREVSPGQPGRVNGVTVADACPARPPVLLGVIAESYAARSAEAAMEK